MGKEESISRVIPTYDFSRAMLIFSLRVSLSLARRSDYIIRAGMLTNERVKSGYSVIYPMLLVER